MCEQIAVLLSHLAIIVALVKLLDRTFGCEIQPFVIAGMQE